jgi:hypothetical protein
MSYGLTSETLPRIGGNLRWRWSLRTGAKRTARLKAVPWAAWLGGGAAVVLGPRQCHGHNGVPAIG